MDIKLKQMDIKLNRGGSFAIKNVSGNDIVKINENGSVTALPYMEEVTWAGLNQMRDEGLLVPGQLYRITDYVTTCVHEEARSLGHQFDIVVLALDESHLDEDARVLPHEGGSDDYFDRTTTIAILTYVAAGEYLSRLARDYSHDYTYEGATYFAWNSGSRLLYTQSDSPEPGDALYDDSHSVWGGAILDVGVIKPNLYKWKAKYTLDNDPMFSWADTVNGKGVIYWLVDENGNEAGYDFKNIVFSRSPFFKANAQYNYVATYTRKPESDFTGSVPYYAWYAEGQSGPPYKHLVFTKTLNIDLSTILYDENENQLSDGVNYMMRVAEPGYTDRFTFALRYNITLDISDIVDNYVCAIKRNKITNRNNPNEYSASGISNHIESLPMVFLDLDGPTYNVSVANSYEVLLYGNPYNTNIEESHNMVLRSTRNSSFVKCSEIYLRGISDKNVFERVSNVSFIGSVDKCNIIDCLSITCEDERIPINSCQFDNVSYLEFKARDDDNTTYIVKSENINISHSEHVSIVGMYMKNITIGPRVSYTTVMATKWNSLSGEQYIAKNLTLNSGVKGTINSPKVVELDRGNSFETEVHSNTNVSIII